jgi:hypothetical protein
MERKTLAIVEAYSERPLLPRHLLSVNLERWPFRLDHLIRLRRGPRTGTEIGVVLARLRGVNLTAIKRTVFVVDLLVGGRRETVYLCHFKVFGDFGAEIQWVSVVV